MNTKNLLLCLIICCSCSGGRTRESQSSMRYASYFDISDSAIVIHSPYGRKDDTLKLAEPFSRLICMSSSYIAYLDAIGGIPAICGVSGSDYISNQEIREGLAAGRVKDVGFEAALDYEKIVSMAPDLFITYEVSSSESVYVSKLKSLGVRVLVIYDQMENHPLARAEYVRLFGALTGRSHQADSAFSVVERNYLEVTASSAPKRRKVLMNIPYAGQWYIPGEDSYMSRLVEDAGGEVLGANPGTAASKTIGLEDAYLLSKDAEFWLNTGWCDTRQALAASNPLFSNFNIPYIYNNTLRKTPGGGNDFWESGAFRCDLVLKDLRAIFENSPDSLYYYIEVK